MEGPLCPTCSLSAVVSLLKRQLFLSVFVNVREPVEVFGGDGGRVRGGGRGGALTAPLHMMPVGILFSGAVSFLQTEATQQKDAFTARRAASV